MVGLFRAEIGGGMVAGNFRCTLFSVAFFLVQSPQTREAIKGAVKMSIPCVSISLGVNVSGMHLVELVNTKGELVCGA